MSDNRETPSVGAPVEETEASRTEILEAVERAKEAPDAPEGAPHGVAGTGEPHLAGPVNESSDAIEELRRREAAAQVDTQMDVDVPANGVTGTVAPGTAVPGATVPAAAAPAAPGTAVPAPERVVAPTDLPSAAAEPTEVSALPPIADGPARDGEIRISPDHPMAALYTQSPLPPEVRGNRGAGTLIALLATVGFAVVYAGVIALWLAPQYPPSSYLDEGLIPSLASVGFGAAVVSFFIALTLLVIIVGRAGWWAYVLGGFFVAALVWAGTVLGGGLHDRFILGQGVSWNPFELMAAYGLQIPVLTAALVAREITIWFGAWIGARGRKIKQQNAEALAEYEQALTEAQATAR